MSADVLQCPSCQSTWVVKSGKIHNGKQNHKCRNCGRQFFFAPQNQPISEGTKRLIDKLLLEKIPLAGIARVAEVSESWLQEYVNKKYEGTPRQVNVKAKKRTFDPGVRRDVVVCWQQGQRAVDLAGN